jgi:hypothetical protein
MPAASTVIALFETAIGMKVFPLVPALSLTPSKAVALNGESLGACMTMLAARLGTPGADTVLLPVTVIAIIGAGVFARCSTPDVISAEALMVIITEVSVPRAGSNCGTFIVRTPPPPVLTSGKFTVYVSVFGVGAGMTVEN